MWQRLVVPLLVRMSHGLGMYRAVAGVALVGGQEMILRFRSQSGELRTARDAVVVDSARALVAAAIGLVLTFPSILPAVFRISREQKYLLGVSQT